MADEESADAHSTDAESADAAFLDALARHQLVFARSTADRSVLTEHGGRTVLVGCTERAILAQWWAEHRPAGSAPAPFVRELSFRQVVGLWSAPDIDLLVDPGPGGGVLVPMHVARSHLGMGPVLPEGDGGEPLPFMGFTGGRASLRLPLLVMLLSLGLLLAGVGKPDLRLVLVGLAGAGASYVLGRRGFGELRAAWRASRRLRQSQRRATP